MSIDALKDALPEYARDVKLNLSALAGDESLMSQQLWGCFLASALACGQADVITQIAAEARARLSPEAFTAAQAAASVMAMNNIYYRFTHLVHNGTYRTMPAKLRMNIIGNPGVDKTDFELWSLAVSAINGCGMCVDSHEQHLLKAGLSAENVQTAVRVAAVVHAVAATLTAEAALQGDQGVSAAA